MDKGKDVGYEQLGGGDIERDSSVSKFLPTWASATAYSVTAAVFGATLNRLNELAGDPLNPHDSMGMGLAQAGVYGVMVVFTATLFEVMGRFAVLGLESCSACPGRRAVDGEDLRRSLLYLDDEVSGDSSDEDDQTTSGCCTIACRVTSDLLKVRFLSHKAVNVVSFVATVAAFYFLNQALSGSIAGSEAQVDMVHNAVNVLGGGFVMLGAGRTLGFLQKHCCAKRSPPRDLEVEPENSMQLQNIYGKNTEEYHAAHARLEAKRTLQKTGSHDDDEKADSVQDCYYALPALL